MKFLINNKEYSDFLAHKLIMSKIDLSCIEPPAWKKTSKYVKELKSMLCPETIPGIELKPKNSKDVDLLIKKIQELATTDLQRWLDNVHGSTGLDHKKLHRYINQRFGVFSRSELTTIHQQFVNANYSTLTKQICHAYQDIGEFYPRDWIDVKTSDDLFIRNTVNNENLIRYRMENNLPFLFMDSGYTNFLESGKKWHRLCRNHIHFGSRVSGCNSKRLDIFPKLPEPWRDGGNQILIVEPSAIQCRMFGIDIDRWKADIRRQLNTEMTVPRTLVFREKIDKKVRQSVYEYLMGEDIYCVISYNSNAAVEALWAGVPAITLGQHITNPVTANRISMIENLVKPNLEPWLKMLSYSQYTMDEIYSGYAREVMKEVLHV